MKIKVIIETPTSNLKHYKEVIEEAGKHGLLGFKVLSISEVEEE